MKTIGLVGGIASGKSLAAQMFRRLGAEILDADRIGHAVLAEDDVRQAISRRWGNEVLAADSSVDRATIARRVFAPGQTGEADRQFLESLLHPRIRERLESQRESLVRAGGPAIVVDAALLFEAGWDEFCDKVVFIDAPRGVRLARALKRGWTEPQFAAREGAQWPVDEKRRRANVILRNEGTEDDLRQAVQAFWDEYVER